MKAMIVERRHARASLQPGAVVAYVGAAAIGVASLWYGLAIAGVTVARRPEFSADESSAERLRRFYDWVVSTLPQERGYASLAILGFLCLATVGVLLVGSAGPEAGLTRIGGSALAIGASLWIVGNVIQLGGHHAVGLMATQKGPLPTVGSIFFTIELIDDAFETAAFAAIGVAGLVLACSGTGPADRAWAACNAVVGGCSAALAAAYVADDGDVVNVLLFALGVLLPLWLVWTGTRVVTTDRTDHVLVADHR
jgi:hypothetical protein